MNLRRLIAWWAALLAVLGGCGAFIGGISCMGSGPGSLNTGPVHPTAELRLARFTSPAVATPGGKITLRAFTNGPVPDGTMKAILSKRRDNPIAGEWEGAVYEETTMYDDGTHGDRQAGDGEWYGEYTCDGQAPAAYTAYIQLDFQHYAWQGLDVPGEIRLMLPEAEGALGEKNTDYTETEVRSNDTQAT